MGNFGLRPVPWTFLDNEYLKIWRWKTEHFEAQITADINSFSWTIIDYIASEEGLFLTEGRTKEFNEAENQVKEAVAKSYPMKYGYNEYAGELATTFTIATGEKIDFGLFQTQRTVIIVKLPDGTLKSFAGTIRVHHYEIWLTPDSGTTIRIQPPHIVKVTGEGSGLQAKARASWTGLGRIYKGTIMKGCNGHPGFLPDTIDHTGEPCRIHEDQVPHFA